MEKNFYDILEIEEKDRTLSDNEFNDLVKKNYKKLARQWHPDKFSTKSEEERVNAEERFKEISEAYNVLSDSNKRREYDMKNNGGFDGGFDPNDFDPFSFFRGRSSGPRIVKGQNVEVEVEITMKESFNGGKTTVKYNKMTSCRHCNGTGSENGVVETCPHCNGTGTKTIVINRGNVQQITQVPCPNCNGTGKKISNPCTHCHGVGMEMLEETETITIPRGVATGQYMVMEERGHEAPKSNSYQTVNGDVIFIFNVKDEGIEFERDGINLIKTVNVDVFDALLGCDIKVNTIDDKTININIPSCTNHGHVFVIKDKGMPHANNNNIIGDMKVIVNCKMPKNLTSKQKELIKKMKDAKHN